MTVKHRIILTGGGTGGHIYPALAVAEELKDDPSVEALIFIGARGHPEEKLAGIKNLDFVGLRISGLPRKVSGNLLSWPLQLASAVYEAQRIIKKFQPTVIFGTGGYASAPALTAAWLMSVPYAIHEPDAHPGLVNRFFSPWAKLVSCGMEGAYDCLKAKRGRIVVNGNPVSRGFVKPLRRDYASAVLGLNPELKTCLITGGSQGARAINEAILLALPYLLELTPPIQIIHQVGTKNLFEYKQRLDPIYLNNPRYCIRDYFDDLSLVLAATDLAVARAGAMTISELAAMGCPALFIPYPFAAADHQSHNAHFMALRGGACVLPQEKLTAESLQEEVLKLLLDDEKLKAMRTAMTAISKPQAAADLAAQLQEVSTAHQIKQSKTTPNT